MCDAGQKGEWMRENGKTAQILGLLMGGLLQYWKIKGTP
jgi:hypothetical protein